MNRILCLLFLLCSPLNAAVEKDLNLAALKKAYAWLLTVSEEAAPSTEPLTESLDLSNNERVWDAYNDIMKRSLVLVRKYPKKVNEQLSLLFTQDNKDILPLVAFYIYSAERTIKSFYYYDPFNTLITPANQENLWVALIPYDDPARPKVTNYSVLIMDLNHKKTFTKD